MKNIFKSKKTLSILAGVLATVVLIGGTWAWFTSSARTGAADFLTAKVELKAEGGTYEVYEFFNGHDFNLEQQFYLEGLLNDPDQGSAFVAWLRNSNPSTWQVGMDQAEYNDYLANREDLEAQMPGLRDALRQARTDYRRAAFILDNLVLGMDAAIDAIYKPDEPTMPLRDDYASGFFGDLAYWADMTVYNAQVWAYDAYMDNIYWPAVEALMDGIEIAEGVKAEYQAARAAARAARDAARAALDELMAAIFNNIVVNTADHDKVTPGSIIYGDFAFENESNIDTYFRIANTVGVRNGHIVTAAVVHYMDETVALIDGGDGYLYCPVKLAEGTGVELVIAAYVFGEANGNDAQVTEFGFGDVTVELIQASNNAAVISGWGAPNLPTNFFQN